SFLDVWDDNGAAIFNYDARNTGTETISYHARLNPTVAGIPAEGPAYAHPEIAEGTLSFEVKECLYKVLMVYLLKAGNASVIGYMDETELAMKSAGTLDGDGDFEFQQTVYGTGCGTSFTVIRVPTHISGTVKQVKTGGDPNAGVDLQFEYGKAETTFTAVCPYAGKDSKSHNIDAATLGVKSVHFPVDGGVKLFYPSLGGKFMVIVTQEVK